MVFGMASVKVTVTMPAEQLRAIRELVADGGAASVSGFVQHAVALALDDITAWQALLAEAVQETGGAISEEERAWADQVLFSARPDPRRPAA